MKIKLTPENKTEQRIFDYLEKNASEALAEKINTGKKTLSGAIAYATAQAKKTAGGSSSACVDDETVFGWIIHFFEEDEVAEPKPAKKNTIRTPGGEKAAPKAAKPEKPDPRRNQTELNLFSEVSK
jgi:hypothetical protein